MLNESELRRYAKDGFVVPDFHISNSTIEAIQTSHERLLSKYPQFKDYCPTLLSYDASFLDYARNDGILDMVEQILGPDIALWNSSFFAKPAKVGSRTPWHQDGEYWPIRPLATCSVWIAVDDSNVSNGCLRVIPGSHRRRELKNHHVNKADGLALPLELNEDEFDVSEAVNVELKQGQVSLHDVYLMHASEPNQSVYPRRGMTLRFMPTTSIYRRDIEMEMGGSALAQQRSLFLMRGTDVSGVNDFRVRSLAQN